MIRGSSAGLRTHSEARLELDLKTHVFLCTDTLARELLLLACCKVVFQPVRGQGRFLTWSRVICWTYGGGSFPSRPRK